jgi:tetratricopeptide (TPR) repeat protein
MEHIDRSWFALAGAWRTSTLRRCTCCLLLLAGQAFAAEGEPAGTPGAEPAPAAPAGDGAATSAAASADAAPAAGTARYLEAVRAIEDEHGAYSAELSQHLLSLGLAYQQAGRHSEAVETLNRAAHVTRVNEGLYATADLPILERLIESYAALGDWEQVDKGYNQLFRIHYRNYGDRDPRLLPALQKLSSWHMRAYLDDTGGEPLNHLLTARNLYDSSVQIMQASYGPADGRIAGTLRQRALVDYYLASYVPTADEGFSFNTETTQQVAAQTYMANSFVAGRDALQRVVELRSQDGNASALQRSQAVAELADWHQLFSRRQAALRIYQEAWTLGSQAGEAAPAVLQSVFGKPLALPVLPSELEGTAPAQPAYITVRFAVNETGRATDMEVVESSPPAADKYISRLRKRLLTTAFRPRFDAGQPVATADVHYRYTYSP